MAAEGYLIYAVGFITPYVRADLNVPAWVAALPSSMMAIGMVSAGILAGRITARLGPRLAARAWASLMAVSAVLLAIPVSIVPILIGALAFGISAGGMLVHVNSALGGLGSRGGTLLMRANMWSVVGGVAGPLVLSAAATSIGWAFGLLAPIPVLLLLIVTLPASPARDRPRSTGERSAGLPRPYWLTWTFLVLEIGAEFSFVVWGSQVVVARTGLTNAEATGLASLYVAGMILGRLALSSGFGSGRRSLTVLRGCASLAAVGAVILWIGTVPLVSGIGLFVGGLGISGIYPLGASLALAHAPDAPVRASARLTGASGGAIFTAPLVLGFAAQAAGVVVGWLLVFTMLGLGLLVLLRIPHPASVSPELAPVATPA
jgi:MFS family permease